LGGTAGLKLLRQRLEFLRALLLVLQGRDVLLNEAAAGNAGNGREDDLLGLSPALRNVVIAKGSTLSAKARRSRGLSDRMQQLGLTQHNARRLQSRRGLPTEPAQDE
jgi:hypothetical protein